MPNPDGLGYFLRAEPLIAIVGKVDNRGFTYFLRAEPFIGIGVAGGVIVRPLVNGGLIRGGRVNRGLVA